MVLSGRRRFDGRRALQYKARDNAQGATPPPTGAMPGSTLIFYTRIDALGDGLLRLPALRAARTAFPDATIVYGCEHATTLERILKRHVEPLIDAFRIKAPLKAIVEEFRPRGPVTVIDLRITPAELIGARLSLIGSGVRYEGNIPGFALSWPPALRPEHNAWRFHRMVERVAGHALPFEHRLRVPQHAATLADELLARDPRPAMLIGGNAESYKLLTESQIAALAAGLEARGLRPVYLKTPGDGPTLQSLAAAVPGLEVLGPHLKLAPEALDDLYLALGEHAVGYVGPEGGMAHFLATVMTPLVVVNPGFNPRRWRSLSNAVEILMAPRSDRRACVVPPADILAAVDRMLAARKRDF